MVSVLIIAPPDPVEASGKLDAIRHRLSAHGHTVQVLSTESGGSFLGSLPAFDLLIFFAVSTADWVLGLLADYRRSGGETPVLVVCHEEVGLSKSAVLDAGGDAIIFNPYSKDDIAVRVQSLMERKYRTSDKIFVVEDTIIVDPQTHQIWCNGESVALGGKEYKVIEFLSLHPGQSFSCRQLFVRLWEPEQGSEDSVRTLVMKLRRKLARLGSTDVIKNSYGVGYWIDHVKIRSRQEVLSDPSINFGGDRNN